MMGFVVDWPVLGGFCVPLVFCLSHDPVEAARVILWVAWPMAFGRNSVAGASLTLVFADDSK